MMTIAESNQAAAAGGFKALEPEAVVSLRDVRKTFG